MKKARRRGRSPLPLILLDLLAVGMVLIVFALFHHVIPRKQEAIGSVATVQSGTAQTDTAQAGETASSEGTASGGDSSSETAGEAEGDSASSEEASAAVGDFSATFPEEDGAPADAYRYYRSDSLQVTVNRVERDEITYFVADVYVKNISNFQSALASDTFGVGYHEWPAETAKKHNAVIGITGDYCGARSEGVVIRNGMLYRESVNSDVCVLYTDGVMETYAQEEFSLSDVISRSPWQAWAFGPRLLDENGQPLSEFNSAVRRKNPRSAIGYYAPGHYCLITVDGRQDGYSVGMTLDELAQTFSSLGCKAAFNLDGGVTAQMVYNGEVINQPADGGRQCSDIICFTGGES